MKTPILGSAYTARSINAADSKMVNLYPEMIPEGGKEPAFLSKREALTFIAYGNGAASVSNNPIRGMIATYDLDAVGTPAVLYVVSGANLYSTQDLITWTNLGAIAGTYSVSMASSGSEIFIATSAGTSYIVDIGTNTLTQITDPDFPGARFVTYLDGFFVFCTLRDQKVWCTGLLNGLSIDALSFASAESFPDPVIGVVAHGGDLWVFGTQTTEVWSNVGTSGFPFAPMQGANINVGCISGLTVAKTENSLYWLGQDTNGRGIVYRANGYTAQRVSTHSIEWQIQDLGVPGPPFVSAPEAEPYAFVYQKDGHVFYVLTFPSPSNSATWVYDVTTEAWHRRSSGDQATRWRARGCAFFAMQTTQYVLVGDIEKNIIYVLSDDYSDSDPAAPETTYMPIEWLRSWRALAPGMNNLKRTAQHSLQLDIETGVHSGVDPIADAQVTLRWSDDGGHTWSSNHTISMGASGNYSKRVIWRRLGMTTKLRDRVYEVSGSHPVKIAIMGAELILSPTNA